MLHVMQEILKQHTKLLLEECGEKAPQNLQKMTKDKLFELLIQDIAQQQADPVEKDVINEEIKGGFLNAFKIAGITLYEPTVKEGKMSILERFKRSRLN